jgi:hypothetical protein
VAKWPLIGSGSAVSADGIAHYLSWGGGDDATEANAQIELYGSYTLSNLRVYCSALTGANGAAITRIGGGADAQTVTITGVGEFEDVTNTDSIVSGDAINGSVNQPTGMHGDSVTLTSWQVTADAATDIPVLAGAGSVWSIANSTTRYMWPFAGIQNSATESQVEYTMRTARTLNDLRVYCSAHSGTTDSLTVRKNRAAGSLTVSVTGTGEFTDLSNTDSFVAGDEFDYHFQNTDMMNPTEFFAAVVEGDTSSSVIGWAASQGASAAYLRNADSTTTEAEAQVKADAAATIQNLFVNCSVYAETRTIRTRKNGANGAASVSVTGTGLFEDLTNTDSLVATDLLSIQQAAGSSGTNVYSVAVEWETAAGGFTATGAVAYPMATVSGSGTQTHTATGAVAYPVPTVAGTGAMLPSATGAVAYPMAAVSGSGTQTQTATGAISYPMASVSGSGTQTQSATGAVSYPMATVSGTGAMLPSATGVITYPIPTVSGTGAQTHTSTGAISYPISTVSGSGAMLPSGSGAVSYPMSTVSGAGTQTHIATGAVAYPVPAVSGTGAQTQTATGAVAYPIPTVSGAGAQTQTATGAIAYPLPAVSGSGAHGAAGATGTGAVAYPMATISGAGAQTQTATGAVAYPVPTVAGTGVQTQTSTGAIAYPLATVSGSGAMLPSATGAIVYPVPAVSGSGAQTHAATGAIAYPLVAVAGTGAMLPSATGAVTYPTPAVSGTGSQTQTATGAVTYPIITVSGTGSVAGPEATGAIAYPMASVSGTGAMLPSATGAVSYPMATVSGSGAQTQAATGSITYPIIAVSGSGLQTQTATGAITYPTITVSGTGAQTQVATGTISYPSPTVSGIGVMLPSGTGAISFPMATVVGYGLNGGEYIVGLPVAGPSMVAGVPSAAALSMIAPPPSAALSLGVGAPVADLQYTVPRIAPMSFDTVPFILVAASDAPQDVRNQTPDEYVCDGTADEVQIQAAYDATGAVMLSDGNFSLAAQVNPPTNSSLRGQGIGKTIVKLADGADDHMVVATTKDSIVIQDIEFDGNGANQTDATKQILRFQDVDDLWVVNCLWRNAALHGLSSQGTSNERWHVIGCSGIGAGKGPASGGGDCFSMNTGMISGEITNCYAEDSDHHLFHLGAGVVATDLIAFSNNAGADQLFRLNGDGASLTGARGVYAAGDDASGVVVENADNVAVSNVWIDASALVSAATTPGFRATGTTTDAHFVNCHVNGLMQYGFRFDSGRTSAVGCSATGADRHGFWANGVDRGRIEACLARNNGQAAGGHSGIALTGADLWVITGNECYDDGTPTQKYGIEELTTSDENLITDNIVRTADHVTGGIAKLGASTIVRDNLGWVTEASGTGTIATGTDVITHGLSVTPTIDDISITLAASGNAVYVDTITSTQFTVHCDADVAFGWRAEVL